MSLKLQDYMLYCKLEAFCISVRPALHLHAGIRRKKKSMRRKHMKQLLFIIAISCSILLIPAFMTSCTRDEDRGNEGVNVETETIDTTQEVKSDESLKNGEEAENEKDSAKGDPAHGKEIFAQNCTPCHGQDGTGGGPTAAALDPKPRDLTDAAYVSTLSTEHLHKVISGGGLAVGKSPAMPAWSTSLSDEDIGDVISYIRVDLCKCEFEGGN